MMAPPSRSDGSPSSQTGSRRQAKTTPHTHTPTAGLFCPYCTTPADLEPHGYYTLSCVRCARVYTDPAAKGMRRTDRGQS